MENNINTAQPVETAAAVQPQIPAGQVCAAAPASVVPAAVSAAQPAPFFDGEGREKRYMFIRKMNSVGNTLLVSILLQSVAAIQVVIIALMVWMFSSMTSFEGLANLMQGDISSTFTEAIMLCAIIANAVAMPISNVLSGYLHSVRNGFTMSSVMGKARWRGSGFWGASVLALGATYAWMFLYMLLGWLLPGSVFDNAMFTTSNYDGAGTMRMIVTAAYVCIGAPLTEEFLCRGVLLKSMSKYGVPFAVFASSLIFGLIHGNIYQTPFAILVGVVLGYVAVRSGSIWPGVIIHFFVNTFATARDFAMVFLPDDYRDAVLFTFYGIAGVLVLASIIILCTGAKKIKWEPIDRQTNNLLLPEVKTKVRCKPLCMLAAVSLLIVIIVYVINILLSCGVTFGLEGFMQTFSE